MYKDVDSIIDKNSNWFDSANGVKRINIIGASFSEVDMKYFDYIVKNHKQINGVKWRVTWHINEDKNKIEAFFERHNIPSTNYKLIHR